MRSDKVLPQEFSHKSRSVTTSDLDFHGTLLQLRFSWDPFEKVKEKFIPQRVSLCILNILKSTYVMCTENSKITP